MIEQLSGADSIFFTRERELSSMPQVQRLAIIENWMVHAAQDSSIFASITEKIAKVGALVGENAQNHRIQKRSEYSFCALANLG